MRKLIKCIAVSTLVILSVLAASSTGPVNIMGVIVLILLSSLYTYGLLMIIPRLPNVILYPLVVVSLILLGPKAKFIQ